jgi:formylglycine-generating enzyme required for sulfatase activity
VLVINDDGGGSKHKSMAGASSPVVDFPPPKLSHKRTALVIGNSDYTNDIFPELENPVNDAKDLAVVLAKLGFEVIVLFNANRQQMIGAIRNFRDKLLINQGVGLFYFSGHGVDYNTKNHLIPLGNQIQLAYDVNETSQTIAVDYVLNEMQMAGNHMNFLILDACREARKIKFSNKPDGKKGMKAIPEGLKVPDLVNGFLIAYAAAPGKAALSGIGERNSPYVKHLMRFIHEPNLSVEAMFKKVGAAVIRETNQEQKPGYYTQLYDPFSFNPQPVKEAKPVVVDNSQTDQRYQELVELIKNQSNKDSQKIAELQAQLAKLTEQLQQKSTTTPVVPTPVKKENTFVAGKVFQDRLKDGGFGPEMVIIPAGSFRMGDIQGGGSSDEQPVHEVSVDRFAMGKFEVTVGEFRKFVNDVNYKTDAENNADCQTYLGGGMWIRVGDNWRSPGFSQNDNHPVVCVTWNDTIAYTKWLSDQTGKIYRLPTEAEWEYAARAGTTTKYWWGNDIGNNHAVCEGCGSKWDDKSTAPSGSFSANPFGLYDTSGNVCEWTCSEYEDKNGKEKMCIEVKSNKNMVLRGGSWSNSPTYLRSAYRESDIPEARDYTYGFRLVRLVTL